MPRERKSSLKAKNGNANDNGEHHEGDGRKTAKKRRTSAAAQAQAAANAANNASSNVNNNASGKHGPGGPELLHVPLPNGSYADTIIANNPFDDMPSHPATPQPNINLNPSSCPPSSTPNNINSTPNNNNVSSMPSSLSMASQMQAPKPVPLMSGKIYPVEQSMVFNPANPNAPPIYPCGICHKEVHDNDQAILCESGCNFWFHRICTGISERAYFLLTKEVYAEWVCDKCLNSKHIPLIKFKP